MRGIQRGHASGEHDGVVRMHDLQQRLSHLHRARAVALAARAGEDDQRRSVQLKEHVGMLLRQRVKFVDLGLERGTHHRRRR